MAVNRFVVYLVNLGPTGARGVLHGTYRSRTGPCPLDGRPAR